MARHQASRPYLAQRRLFNSATVTYAATARLKPAPFGQMNGTWHIAAEHGTLGNPVGIGYGDGAHQGLGIGVQLLLKQCLAISNLHQFAKIHYANSVGHEPHRGHAVRYKQIGHSQLLLQIF